MKTIIVLVGIVFISVIGIYLIRKAINKEALNNSVDNLALALKSAQLYAQESKAEADWGVVCKDIYSYQMLSKINNERKVEGEFGLDKTVSFSKCGWEIWFENDTGNSAIMNQIELITNSGNKRFIKITN